MATEYIDPNGDVAATWSVANFNNINDGVRQPAVPPPPQDTADPNDDNEVRTVSFPSMSGNGVITAVTLWAYMVWSLATGSGHYYWRLYFNGAWQAESGCCGNTDGWGWKSKVYAGLTLAPSDLDDLLLRIRPTNIENAKIPDLLHINGVYVEVTYTPSAPTGPAGIAKVYGIASASVGKKYGVSWSDIKEIYGIS